MDLCISLLSSFFYWEWSNLFSSSLGKSAIFYYKIAMADPLFQKLFKWLLSLALFLMLWGAPLPKKRMILTSRGMLTLMAILLGPFQKLLRDLWLLLLRKMGVLLMMFDRKFLRRSSWLILIGKGWSSKEVLGIDKLLWFDRMKLVLIRLQLWRVSWIFCR